MNNDLLNWLLKIFFHGDGEGSLSVYPNVYFASEPTSLLENDFVFWSSHF